MNSQAVYRPFGALRFILALMVACQHGVHLLPSDAQGFLFRMGFGIIGVAVFFVISGFVVGEANHVFYRGRAGSFLINRTLRIVPPYLGALLVQILAATYLYNIGAFKPWDFTLEGSPLQPLILIGGILTLLPGLRTSVIAGQHFEFFAFVWSLRIELTFYLAAAAVYWVSQSARVPNWINRFAGVVGLGVGYGLFALFLLRENVPQQFGLVPFFLLGVAGFIAWQKRTARTWLHLIAALGCVGVAFPLWRQTNNPDIAAQIPILLSLLLLAGALAFMPSPAPLLKKIDVFLGNLSYPLYLNHYVVLLSLSNLFPEEKGGSIYVVGLALSLLLSCVMHYVIETPLRVIRDRVRGTEL